MEDLDRHGGLEARVATAIDGPLPAGSEDLFENVGPESLAGLGKLLQGSSADS